ncbi:uncharacterized protein LOC144618637 isoform X3 [Crassostrea virginica]
MLDAGSSGASGAGSAGAAAAGAGSAGAAAAGAGSAGAAAAGAGSAGAGCYANEIWNVASAAGKQFRQVQSKSVFSFTHVRYCSREMPENIY